MRRGNVSLFSAAAHRSVMSARDEALIPFQVYAVPAPFDATALPPMQQAALLTMHESVVKRALIARLLEDAQSRPDAPDYAALCERGLAERKHGYRFRTLTDEGRASVKEMQRKLCMRFGIHLLSEGGRRGWQVHYSCPCGFSTLVRASTTARGNAAARHHGHVRAQEQIAAAAQAMQAPMKVEAV